MTGPKGWTEEAKAGTSREGGLRPGSEQARQFGDLAAQIFNALLQPRKAITVLAHAGLQIFVFDPRDVSFFAR